MSNANKAKIVMMNIILSLCGRSDFHIKYVPISKIIDNKIRNSNANGIFVLLNLTAFLLKLQLELFNF